MKKGLIIIVLAMLMLWLFVFNRDDHKIDLKIQFTTDEEVIYLPLTVDEYFNCFAIIRGFNGQLEITPQQIDLSVEQTVTVNYTISFNNQKKSYRKTFVVKQLEPQIIVKDSYVNVLLNQTIDFQNLYEVINLGTYDVEITENVDTSAVGQYICRITVQTKDYPIEETIYINVLEKIEPGCSYRYVVDQDEVLSQGHYQSVWINPVGHYETVLVSPQQGHYQTIHHPGKTIQQPIYQSYKLYTFYHQDESKNIIIEDYLLYEKTGYSTAAAYFVYLSQQDEGYLGYYFETKERIVGYETVVEEQPWDETVWVIDKEAQYEEVYIIDQAGYYKQVWIEDVPYQKQQGHFEAVCN